MKKSVFRMAIFKDDIQLVKAKTSLFEDIEDSFEFVRRKLK